MTVVVTLHVFSGRPDPTFTISDHQAEQLETLLEKTEGSATFSRPPGVDARLGYRGFSIARLPHAVVGLAPLYVHSGVIDRGPYQIANMDENHAVETFLANCAEPYVDPEMLTYVRQEITNPRPTSIEEFMAVGCPPCHAGDAPSYAPGPWNSPPTQQHNNCYNYANNHITNTFAQPGRAHGKATATMQCPNVSTAAQADGLRVTPDFSAPLGSGHGWYVALVVWPNNDYHWYRQDNVGCWSHKPGQTTARNVDNSGRTIADPKTCNRGPYNLFCGYMTTNRSVAIK